jgi:hypothetical protein
MQIAKWLKNYFGGWLLALSPQGYKTPFVMLALADVVWLFSTRSSAG